MSRRRFPAPAPLPRPIRPPPGIRLGIPRTWENTSLWFHTGVGTGIPPLPESFPGHIPGLSKPKAWFRLPLTTQKTDWAAPTLAHGHTGKNGEIWDNLYYRIIFGARPQRPDCHPVLWHRRTDPNITNIRTAWKGWNPTAGISAGTAFQIPFPPLNRKRNEIPHTIHSRLAVGCA